MSAERLAPGHNRPPFQSVPAGVYGLCLAAYAALFLTYWLVFGAHAEAAFMVAVSTVLLTAYVAVPAALWRVTPGWRRPPREGSFGDFMAGELDTFTGPISGPAALAQIVAIPLGLAGATMAIGCIIAFTR